MTTTDEKLLKQACCEQPEAMDFVWNHLIPYCTEVDDIVDGETKDPDQICTTFARAILLFTHPFFLKNISVFRQLMLNVTLAYADSAVWEKSDESWKREWSDHYRHIGVELVLAVAMICGGYANAQKLSREYREILHHAHHDPQTGQPN